MDVTGIVALVLAAGGAAYLIRARLISSKPAQSSEKGAAAREQATLPPTLRPTDDKPAKKKSAGSKSTAPATPQAKTEAEAAVSKRESLAKDKEEPKPASVKTEAAKVEEKTDEKKPESAKKIEAAKIEPPKVEPPKVSEKTDAKESESRAAVTQPPAADSKQPPPIEVKLAPLVESNPKITPAPVTVPEKKFNKKATIVGIAPIAKGAAPAPKSEAKPAAPPKSPAPEAPPVAKKKEIPVIDVPRLDTDEDEELEPTRVGRYERQSIRPPIEKHVFDEGADADKKRASVPLQLAVFALAQSDPGRRRKQNEDSYLVREKDTVFVVADGMGGHRGGEFASKIAVETIDGAFEKKTFEAEAHADLPQAASELARAIQMANAAILGEASRRPELKGMGTTLCAARFTDENRRLFLGHVGDSRCYRVRGGVMKQMTTDHTMADYGVAGPEGAHLSRALGVWPTVPIDIIMATPELGDVYLICSDGLTKMLPEQTIQTQLLHEEDPKTAVQRLIFFANSHGGKDNITVVLLRVVEPGWVPPSERAPATSA